jgi:hypothetical protein
MKDNFTQSEQVAFEASSEIMKSEFVDYMVSAIDRESGITWCNTSCSYNAACMVIVHIIDSFAKENEMTRLDMLEYMSKKLRKSLIQIDLNLD